MRRIRKQVANPPAPTRVSRAIDPLKTPPDRLIYPL
jgi:hypothetical protein